MFLLADIYFLICFVWQKDTGFHTVVFPGRPRNGVIQTNVYSVLRVVRKQKVSKLATQVLVTNFNKSNYCIYCLIDIDGR